MIFLHKNLSRTRELTTYSLIKKILSFLNLYRLSANYKLNYHHWKTFYGCKCIMFHRISLQLFLSPIVCVAYFHIFISIQTVFIKCLIGDWQKRGHLIIGTPVWYTSQSLIHFSQHPALLNLGWFFLSIWQMEPKNYYRK